MTHYETLGVEITATPEEIKTSYRKLAMIWHPDKNQGDEKAEAKFKEINEAHEILSDPVKRQKYDNPQQGFHHFGFGGGGLDEILNSFFHNVHPHHVHRNQNINVGCEISLEDAFKGCEVQFNILGRDIKIKIPPGVDNGVRMRVEGAGQQQHANLPPGDVHVIIQIKPSNNIHRENQTLISQVDLDAFTAILGGQVSVTTIDGDIVKVDTPKGAQNGSTVTLAERGMPPIGGGRRGDHVIIFNIVVPILDDRQLSLLKKACKKI